MKNQFTSGFEKIAVAKLPAWARKLHTSMQPGKNIKNFSLKSIHQTKAGKGLKK